MKASLQILSERAHRPLIHFLGKRRIPQVAHIAAPHPAGPLEYKEHFDDFLKKFRAEGPKPVELSKSSNVKVYQEFWELPSKYLVGRDLAQWEIEAIEVRP
ncbi:hypothetical protein SISSUDRAFT_1060045 [Sistotremastrum suecicum HHB10207 ss-3]|uniref:Uncharacterized protein n=1 Tax=Sistotremastrum suecicum HHB10207 ss-3 TaxID=1314776 RepID=A0A166FIX4_9AGAM|nr:hypothetical protein SISSUDRAFT_1060045 [Sistotremastrum suecicum HHB10207 ss-3]